MQKSLYRRYQREWLLVALLILGITLFCSRFSIFSRISSSLYDKVVSYTHVRQPDHDIVMIVIDDKSLARIGFWPWRRSLHARLLERLHRARAVGFDILFSDADWAHPQDDDALSGAIRRNGKVVLAYFLSETAMQRPVRPVSGLSTATRHLGFINIVPDPDGTVRRIRLFSPNDPSYKHLALAMLEAGGQTATVDRLRAHRTEPPFLIPFVGAPLRFPMIPYSEVLAGDVPADYFANKYVLIGAWGTGMGDSFPTPVSADTIDNMAGVEVLANVLQSAREGNWIRHPDQTMQSLISLAPVLLLLVAVRRLSPRRVLLATGIALMVVLSGTLLTLYLGNYWISPVAAMMGIALTYPIWSWRTQEIALSQMSREMGELNREYPLLGAEVAATDPAGKDRLSLNERVMQLRFGLNRVRSLRRFISDSFNAIADPAVVFDAHHQLTLWSASATRYMTSLNAPPLTDGLHIQAFLETIIADPVVCRELVAAIDHPEQAQDGHTPQSGVGAWAVHTDKGYEVRDCAGRDLLLKSMSTHTATGRHSGFILNLIDISALRQAERRRDDTLRFISHDMRAPQASILALIDLQQHPAQALPAGELLQQVKQLSTRTIRLVDDFVQFTRAEQSGMDFVPLNLSDLLQDAVNEFWAASRARHITIVNEDGPVCAFVRGDQSLLTRCFGNLLDNALKYSPDHTTVTCTIVSAGDFWEVTIRDQGRGISQQDQKALFTRFSRVSPGEADDPGGLGLGLLFVKTVVTRHHGDIRVRSAPAWGSDFIVRLPKDEPEESDEPSL